MRSQASAAQAVPVAAVAASHSSVMGPRTVSVRAHRLNTKPTSHAAVSAARCGPTLSNCGVGQARKQTSKQAERHSSLAQHTRGGGAGHGTTTPHLGCQQRISGCNPKQCHVDSSRARYLLVLFGRIVAVLLDTCNRVSTHAAPTTCTVRTHMTRLCDSRPHRAATRPSTAGVTAPIRCARCTNRANGPAHAHQYRQNAALAAAESCNRDEPPSVVPSLFIVRLAYHKQTQHVHQLS